MLISGHDMITFDPIMRRTPMIYVVCTMMFILFVCHMCMVCGVVNSERFSSEAQALRGFVGHARGRTGESAQRAT